MYSEMRYIDRAFRYIRVFAAAFLLACAGLTGMMCWYCARTIRQAADKVYVLDEGQIREAQASSRADNLGVEARDHVRMFQMDFFTLDPDINVIRQNIQRSYNLADACAKRAYDRLDEQRYFNDVVVSNITQRVQEDTVVVNTNKYPYYFRSHLTLAITRPSVITLRHLETEGYLRTVSRSDDNPHGFLIERWQITDSRDIRSTPRNANP